MNVTEPIINAALLGTATKEFTPSGFPEALEENFCLLQEKAEDTEDAFYQIAALTFAYQRAGTEPQSAEETTAISEAPEDSLPYFDRSVGEMLVQNGERAQPIPLIICLPESSTMQQADSTFLSAPVNLPSLRPQ